MRPSLSKAARINRRSVAAVQTAIVFAFFFLAQGCASPRVTPLVFPTAILTTPTPNPEPTFDLPVKPTVIRTVMPSLTPETQPSATASPKLSPTPTSPSGVEVQRNGSSFVLLVNGQPTIVRGMNYNVNYTNLPEETQWKLHRRDFQILREAGVNMVIGWGIYDEITLRVAEDYDIGVIMPFELDPESAFENKDYQDQVKSEFREYITRFRGFPAVWGWNPGGDELLYRMRTEKHRTNDKLQVAANLELELVALAHSLDPSHIIVVKEPRDWFIKYLGAALEEPSTQPGFQDLNRSLVYGVNVYGRFDDIDMTLRNARQTLNSQLGLAMMVTEFGPFNSPPADRPADYAGIWDIVSEISNFGGCAYAFGPDQPNPGVKNPYDPLTLLPSEYSLVDMNGTPVDDSLAALAAKWLPLTTPTLAPSLTPTLN